MKRMLLLLLAGAVSVASLQAAPGDVQIVANPSVAASEVSADELKGVFTGTKTRLADGSNVEPVLSQFGAAHVEFLKAYVGKTDQALRDHFKALVFTGKASMPKSFMSDAEIVKYVAATKGAIGYVSASTAAAGVKTLKVK
jgi:ABC-type phosphate transport system substrate-binding protein